MSNEPPTPAELYDERLMFAWQQLGRIVNHPSDGWQERYCEHVDKVAKSHNVDSADLVQAFMRHYGADIVNQAHVKSRSPEEQVVCRIRDELIDLHAKHAETCTDPACRWVGNLLAFLAHSLGAVEGDIRDFHTLFVMYEMNCQANSCDVHRN